MALQCIKMSGSQGALSQLPCGARLAAPGFPPPPEVTWRSLQILPFSCLLKVQLFSIVNVCVCPRNRHRSDDNMISRQFMFSGVNLIYHTWAIS